MCLGLGLHFVMPAQNADEASRQRREELNRLRSGDALSDCYRASRVHAVILNPCGAICTPSFTNHLFLDIKSRTVRAAR
jgi:hypothetical protein